jgi:hypothetical protein
MMMIVMMRIMMIRIMMMIMMMMLIVMVIMHLYSPIYLDADQSYCLQLSLRLPPLTMASGVPVSVTGLICSDTYYQAFAYLWATDNSGR